MGVLQVILLTVLSVGLVSACGSSGGSNSGSSRCVSRGGSGHTGLYNTCVVRAQRYRRPLLSGAADILAAIGIYHQGVVVTLDNGQRWLVHKGDEYGRASETVVVDARFMSSAWSSVGFSKTIRNSNVGDYVDAGGRNYKLCCDNCIHAANRMMNLN